MWKTNNLGMGVEGQLMGADIIIDPNITDNCYYLMDEWKFYGFDNLTILISKDRYMELADAMECTHSIKWINDLMDKIQEHYNCYAQRMVRTNVFGSKLEEFDVTKINSTIDDDFLIRGTMQKFQDEVLRLEPPKVPQWLQQLRDDHKKWIDTYCGLSDAMRGCSEQFQSAKIHAVEYELNMRRAQDEINKHWYKPVLKEENKMNRFKFWKAIKSQAKKVEAMFQAMKWMQMIRLDGWDEEWVVNKPTANLDGMQMNIPIIIHNLKLLLIRNKEIGEREEIIDKTNTSILDRLKAVEEKEERNHETAVTIDKLIDYFFVSDYFINKGNDLDAGCNYPKFRDFIPRETAVSFEKLNKRIYFDTIIDIFFIEKCFTSSKNALEHKATIARYTKEVVNYKKTLKKEK